MGVVRSGTVSWVDLSTPDIAAAHSFYTGLFGWELDVQRTPMGEYTVASSGSHEVAGMMAQDPDVAEMPTAWTVFVVVDDMKATLTAVTEAGGEVRQAPFEIPDGAQVAVVADRTGAMLALISGGPEPGSLYYSEDIGAVCWTELMTRDVRAAVEFYGQVFGWTAETDDTGPVPYTVCNLDGNPVAGVIGRSPDLPAEAPDSWSVYFTVGDCHATQSRAAELGGSVILPATPTPMGPFAVLADPAGAVFQVMEMNSQSSPSGR